MHRTLVTRIVERKLTAPFAIARGTIDRQETLRVEIVEGAVRGRGEAVGVTYQGETPRTMRQQVEAIRSDIEAGASREALIDLLPAGGARAACDAALWDLEGRRDTPAWKAAGLSARPEAPVTAFTITLARPEEMAAAAAREAHRPLLKVKLGGGDGLDAERARAVRDGAPSATLIADGNEGCRTGELDDLAQALADLGYALLEQPLPRTTDHVLEEFDAPLPLCADESLMTIDQLDDVARRYSYGNIKLDKCGGLTAGLALAGAMQARRMGIFVGCMLGGTIAVAPAFLLAPFAEFVDLDGPLWMAEDDYRMDVDGAGRLPPPPGEVWGG